MIRPPGGWGWPAQTNPAIEVTTDSNAPSVASVEPQPGRGPSASACVPYRAAIELGLSRGRNAMAIWQDLVDQCGFAAGYQSARRFVRHVQANSAPEPRAVIETPPGEEVQVDYGSGPPGARLAERQVPAHPLVRAHPRLQPEVGPAADVPLQFSDLGRTA